jgi:hypothetical protein
MATGVVMTVGLLVALVACFGVTTLSMTVALSVAGLLASAKFSGTDVGPRPGLGRAEQP